MRFELAVIAIALAGCATTSGPASLVDECSACSLSSHLVLVADPYARWCEQPGARVWTGDFDGDGDADPVCHWANNWSAAVSEHSLPDAPGLTGWCDPPHDRVRLADVDGDGRTDLLCHWGNITAAALSNGDGTFSPRPWFERFCATRDGDHTPFGVRDVNADGLDDLVCDNGEMQTFALSIGDGGFVRAD